MTAARRSPARAASPRTSPLSEVAPGVFVGGWKEAERFSGARICVLDERPAELDGWPGTEHVPIYDGAKDAPLVENLDRVADWMHRAHATGAPVMVFCGHGVRRGSLGGAWYLHRYAGMTLTEAFDAVAAVRPQIERPEEWIGHAELLEPSGGGSRRGRHA